MISKLILSTLLVSSVFAQSETPTDWDVNYTKTIDSSTKASWCARQVYACKTICYTSDNPEPKSNTCDADTLNYSCTCGDGVVPKLSTFTDTIYYYECNEVKNRCAQNCGGKANEQQCKSDCQNKYQCATTAPNSADRQPLSGAKKVDLGNSATLVSTTFVLFGAYLA
eukprot:NODE_164_length_14719_cov_1.036252.p9 type:complete len:168 gc:universal NODE_164_length_14719_cov_1.036252:2002-2505(+)